MMKYRTSLILATILFASFVASVYGIQEIGHLIGGNVVVTQQLGGLIKYSTDKLTWGNSLSVISSVSWYTVANITTGSTSYSITVMWYLESLNPSTQIWEAVSGSEFTTNFANTFSPPQLIYATDNGLYAGVWKNWGEHTQSTGTFRVSATIFKS